MVGYKRLERLSEAAARSLSEENSWPLGNYGFVERWSVRRTVHGKPLITEEHMRKKRLFKSNELTKRCEPWARAILLLASLTVTRLGVFLLVGR